MKSRRAGEGGSLCSFILSKRSRELHHRIAGERSNGTLTTLRWDSADLEWEVFSDLRMSGDLKKRGFPIPSKECQ